MLCLTPQLTRFEYRLYGLRLVANKPIAGLLPSSAESGPAVHVSFGEWPDDAGEPAATSGWVAASQTPSSSNPGYRLLRRGGDLRFSYRDGTDVIVSMASRRIWMRWPPDLSQEDAVTYLVGPVLGSYLRWSGALCLHASCVSLGEVAFALMGGPGAGKSTTASAFSLRGFPVMSDDITRIDERGAEFFAVAGYPRLCLWPESVAALFGDANLLPRITPTWDKRYVPLGQDGRRFQTAIVPLECIYVLGPRSDEPTAPSVEPIAVEEAFILLVANTYGNTVLDVGSRQTEFEILDRLVRNVPVRRVIPHADVQRVDELCEAIVTDMTLTQRSA